MSDKNKTTEPGSKQISKAETLSMAAEEFSGSFHGRKEPRRPSVNLKMIITTWIVYIFARKTVGLPFPPKTNSDIEVVESEAVSIVQHWLNKTEEEASRSIKEKMSTNIPPTHGHDIHVTRDVVKHPLSKCDMLSDPSQEVLEERTRIQFIRWSHTRIFQVPSEMIEDVMQDRIDEVRRRLKASGINEQPVSKKDPPRV